MEKTLIITVGLPRSGKSTYARATGHPIVNPDSIRLALHGKTFEPAAEAMVWTIARYMVKALFLAGHDTVVLDATNVTRRRRNEWRSRDWTCKYRVFSTDAQTCISRPCGDELKPVILRMAADWEDLSAEEETHQIR